ncbi:MAG: NADP oxidoreductase [Gammaproteobacteria bacterium]|nr:NADP oxidoreductase [Gammaproteobacteria bacterium]MCI0590300.1 NADP oxidoreductase [Gammaproteobacteria bacterium]
MSTLGTERNPLRVAIVGSGPSGFYASESLLKSGYSVRVDMLERLPAPYGLVRNGVAPDHPKLKQAILVYEKIAEGPEFNFLGNVSIGRDLTIEELQRTHHAIIFACGAEADRKLGIPGEDLSGSHTATEFVGWYNGHPDYRDRTFNLSNEVAVIIGQGNVAADVCRLLGKTVDELKHTDIAEHALAALAESKIREIHVVGRRGPAQAKFTPAELRELGEMADCDPVVAPGDLDMNPESLSELVEKTNMINAKNIKIFQEFAQRAAPTKRRRCYFHFLKSPIELTGDGHLKRVIFEKNRLKGDPFQQVAEGTTERKELACGLLFRSIGYRGVPIPGAPFDERRGVFLNKGGRLIDKYNSIIPGLYAAGWIKRGPTGIIGTNRADSVATVKALLEDLGVLSGGEKPGAEGLYPYLAKRGIRVVSFSDWRAIDAAEVERGRPKGKPREKFTTVKGMLAVLNKRSETT